MKYLFLSFIFLASCQFHPLYSEKTYSSVCVQQIPESLGYQLYKELNKSFSDQTNCTYQLHVSAPQFNLSDQSISDNDFITMQRIQAKTTYKLLNSQKKTVLSNTVSADGSSAVVTNPYATVVSIDKTQQNLIPILADQIVLHITAYLDRNTP